MIREVKILPEAVSDITEAYRWYENKAKGLGLEFVRAVDARLDFIRRNPLASSPIHKDARRILLRRFPYGLYYLVEDEWIAVLACFHARRDPALLRSRR
ncbi:MAG: type II toxin-antitoxin system RelE/ParE family toxin [Acidobacteriia bacterium]|nr:type II toxin-antitoxin system RelE/ParE family toxin [Terriglobia bacterium]